MYQHLAKSTGCEDQKITL